MNIFPAKKILNWLLCQNPWLYRVVIQIYSNQGRRQKYVYLKFVKKGNCAIDIGANVGDVTLLLSNIVGKEGKVFSYEAVKPTYEKLLLNINANKFYNNITAFNLAVGDVEKEISVTVPGNGFGQVSMQVHKKGSWNSASRFTVFKTHCILLDHHMADFKKVDFIKIDIEGAELLALKGAVEIINKFKPVLYVEVYKGWTKEFNYHPLDVYQYIKSFGYSEYFIVTPQTITRLTNPELQLNLDYSADLICIYN